MNRQPSTGELTLAFARNHPAEMASFLAAGPADVLSETVLALPEAEAAAVASHLPPEPAGDLLRHIDDAKAARWIAAGSVGEAVNLVVRLDPARREHVLGHIPDRTLRHRIERLVVYPRRTLGALADATATRLNGAAPLREAVAILKAQQNLDHQPVWVVDADGRLLGQLDLARALVASREETRVGDCLITISPLPAESALLDAHDDPRWTQHLILPVVDYDGHLLGHVSREQLLEALSEDSPHASSVGEAVSTLANQYLRFLSESLADLLGGRQSR